MQLMQYYDQMKQSILENGKYVDALLETAEAVYTVNLTEDTLENYRIVDTSEKLIGRFTDGDKQVVVEYLEKAGMVS